MQDELFKVQRAIVSNDPCAALLVYNKDKSTMLHNYPETPELTTLFKDDLKMFVRGHFDDEVKLVIDGVRYPDPGW